MATFELRNGVRFPAVGFGTFEVRGPACRAAVSAALRCGYARVDTAAVYRNHGDVADGIADSGVARDAVFLVTKVGPSDHGDRAYAAALRALDELRTPYADLLLVHWPGVAGMRADAVGQRELRVESWRALVRLAAEGRARSIGVSNFTPAHLAELAAAHLPAPHVNQVELTPLLPQDETRAACAGSGIVVDAYSPLARASPQLLEHPAVLSAAAAAGRTPAQVVLRWALQRGCAVTVKSVRAARIAENLDVVGWALGADAMVALDAAGSAPPAPLRTCWDPTLIA